MVRGQQTVRTSSLLSQVSLVISFHQVRLPAAAEPRFSIRPPLASPRRRRVICPIPALMIAGLHDRS